jgi:methyltransferase (TIGR00027 family)
MINWQRIPKGPRVARTSDDSWDITQGVGATALGVAMARAAETRRADRLFDDPYAQLFIDTAAGLGWRAPTGALIERIRLIGDYAACRTRWFDEFFTAASSAGIRQAVILAAGLDARAFRLPWARGTVVYEIDQPEVLRFKAETLSEHGVRTTAARYAPIGIDLRQDWPAALREAGFDANQPSAWSAEGLLPYLPASGQDLLFERVDALCAVGSRLGVEAFGAGFFDPAYLARRREQVRRLREQAGESADATPDVGDLWYIEERTDVGGWLVQRGWRVESIESSELIARYGRGGETDNLPRTVYVTGTRD